MKKLFNKHNTNKFISLNATLDRLPRRLFEALRNDTFVFIILILTILISAKSFAASEITKTLNMSVNTSHLLTFDEKIIRYKLENEKDFKAEILSNIFNNRQELLIKPLKKIDNKLTVWTESKIYNLNIDFKQSQELKIREITDKSPVLSEDTCGMTDFDLDNPPKSKEK